MRALALAALVVVITGCPAQQGPEGPQGAQGPQGPQGPAGATGPQGPAGADGAPGAQGPRGADGATGPQGVQGPAGMVVVVDGGVVVGPPGASVVVTPISAGATCATGGVRITQLSDGGISNVCNGAAGPAGPQGAVGPAGPSGVQGVAGVTASVLSVMSTRCPTGGVLLTFADAGTSAVCNGAQGAAGAQGVAGPQGIAGPQGPAGAAGATGPTGATGAAGPMGPAGATGPQGPQGPAGPALLLDGGALTFTDNADGFSFAGFTTATFDGNLGGFTGANQKCNAEFSGAHLCTIREFNFTGSYAAAGAVGAWVDDVTFDTGFEPRDRSSYWTCRDWRTNDGPNTYTKFLDAQGSMAAPAYNVCNVARPLACCRSPHRAWFRGFTTATYDGNLGGVTGAAAKCRTEFPGSHFCTIREFEWAAPATAAGATGAWVDDVDRPGSTKYDVRPRDRSSYWTCRDWRTNDGPNTYTRYLDSQGSLSAPAYNVCNVARQLACCGP